MKNKIPMRLSIAAFTVATAQLLAQSSSATKSTNTSTKTKDPAALQVSAGQRKFDANCSRCHSAPEQLSPSLTGTVVRHMRVRASLSAQDEKDILKFLAP